MPPARQPLNPKSAANNVYNQMASGRDEHDEHGHDEPLRAALTAHLSLSWAAEAPSLATGALTACRSQRYDLRAARRRAHSYPVTRILDVADRSAPSELTH